MPSFWPATLLVSDCENTETAGCCCCGGGGILCWVCGTKGLVKPAGTLPVPIPATLPVPIPAPVPMPAAGGAPNTDWFAPKVAGGGCAVDCKGWPKAGWACTCGAPNIPVLLTPTVGCGLPNAACVVPTGAPNVPVLLTPAVGRGLPNAACVVPMGWESPVRRGEVPVAAGNVWVGTPGCWDKVPSPFRPLGATDGAGAWPGCNESSKLCTLAWETHKMQCQWEWKVSWATTARLCHLLPPALDTHLLWVCSCSGRYGTEDVAQLVQVTWSWIPTSCSAATYQKTMVREWTEHSLRPDTSWTVVPIHCARCSLSTLSRSRAVAVQWQFNHGTWSVSFLVCHMHLTSSQSD